MSADSDAQTVNWILTAIAIALTAGRYGIRYHTNRRLYVDDAIHGFALVILIIHGATNQVTLNAKAQLAVNTAKGNHISQAALLAEYHHLYQLNTTNNTFLYATMWIVKVAFLFFYRQVFQFHKLFMRLWWALLVFTIITYIPPFAGVVATCASANTIPEYKECNSENHYRQVKLTYTCVLNVVSDVLIMALPLWMLPKLQIHLRQKIGLAFVFSIGLFLVALDILRTVEAVASHQALFTVLEINFFVIVSCLPTYRRLLSVEKFWSTLRGSSRNAKLIGQSGQSDESSGWKSRRKQSTTLVGTMSQEEYAMDDGTQSDKAHLTATELEAPTRTRDMSDMESQGDGRSLASSHHPTGQGPRDVST